MEGRKSRNFLIFAIIGVITLIAIIVGVSFAFFSISANNNSTINGTSASASIDIDISLLAGSATGNMVPQLSGEPLDDAIGKGCVDSNNNTVCKLYKIDVTNTGNTTLLLDGTFELSGGTFSDLKWALVSFKNNEVDLSKASAGTVNSSSVTTLVEDVQLTLEDAVKSYYVVIWIEETGSKQNDSNTGTFVGSVTFEGADGTGLTSTFTS